MSYIAKAVVLASVFISSTVASAGLSIDLSDIKQAGSQFTYTYSFNASDMKDPDCLKQDAEFIENVTLRNHRGVYYIDADHDVANAQIVYKFDFSDLPMRPTSVTWQDRLTVFPHKTDSERSTMISEWSVDGKSYTTIQEVTSVSDKAVDSGKNTKRNKIDLPSGTNVVYYRVRFEPNEKEGKLVGGRNQWNRSGTNTLLFRASFELKPLTTQSSSEGINVKVMAMQDTPHIFQDMVYPAAFWTLDTSKGWRFLGATHGHSGGVESVDAPNRSGDKALLCHVTVNKTNPKAPSWLTWEKPLDPQLNIQGAKELIFDIYPLDPIDFDIYMQLGREKGFGIISATWKSIGKLKPGRWPEIRIPIHPTRPSVDAFRLTFPCKAPNVPDRQPIRFVIDNIRLDPKPESETAVFTVAMRAASPVKAAYFQHTSANQVSDDEAITFDLEISSLKKFKGVLQVHGRNKQSNQTYTWQAPVSIDTQHALVTTVIDHPSSKIGVGLANYQIELVSEDSVLMASNLSLEVSGFTSEHMNQKRHQLLKWVGQIERIAAQLKQKGIGVKEPSISLAVASWFLKDDGFVESDYKNQKAYGIAMKQLDDIQSILDRTQLALNDRATGKITEMSSEDFKSDSPVKYERGQQTQDGKPLLMIGPISDGTNTHLLPELGFNAVARETGIRDWFSKYKGHGEKFLNQFLKEGKDAGISLHLLASSHYLPEPMPKTYAKAKTPDEGSGMFPWDVLSPQADRLFENWYQQMTAVIKDEQHLVSIGLANEPGYHVKQTSQSFTQAFPRWIASEYVNIDVANKQWDSQYDSIKSIDLKTFFELRKQSKGAEWDWQRFVDQQVTSFFQKRKNDITSQMPDKAVWTKLMGHETHFGFAMLNEHTNVSQAQTVLGTDGGDPIWLDYLKSINPNIPIYNTEWHFMGGVDPNDTQQIQMRMVDGVTHGIQTGLIWIWWRTPWNSMANGGEQSIIRWPKTTDIVGRTSFKLRALAEPMIALGNADGGKVRLLYSLSANTHQGVNYIHNLQATYDSLNRNASGHRFVFTHSLTSDDLKGVSLLAASNTQYIEPDAARILAKWVQDGGTLWFSSPVTWFDPWGHPVENQDNTFEDA
ncbi:MAG TPA: hypothetical protein DCM28_09720, partial [Phycisphaerales bacterium]|nr:hypothetical protein [Phycisphaerales bacterium]